MYNLIRSEMDPRDTGLLYTYIRMGQFNSAQVQSSPARSLMVRFPSLRIWKWKTIRIVPQKYNFTVAQS